MYAATSILSFENQAAEQEILEDKFLDQTYAVTYFQGYQDEMKSLETNQNDKD